MNIKFPSSGQFWNWLVVSSADPASVALTVKGIFSLTATQTLFSLLPLVGVHPSFTLTVAGASAYSVVYSLLTVVSSVVAAVGAIRKVLSYFTAPAAPAKPTGTAVAADPAQGQPAA